MTPKYCIARFPIGGEVGPSAVSGIVVLGADDLTAQAAANKVMQTLVKELMRYGLRELLVTAGYPPAEVDAIKSVTFTNPGKTGWAP